MNFYVDKFNFCQLKESLLSTVTKAKGRNFFPTFFRNLKFVTMRRYSGFYLKSDKQY